MGRPAGLHDLEDRPGEVVVRHAERRAPENCVELMAAIRLKVRLGVALLPLS
jgi:hypothetical protein